MLHQSNSDINITRDHLKLVEEKHIFRLDPSLFNLKVYSSTFICLKVPTRSAQNLKMQWWLIGDKMLMSLLKKMRCKYLMKSTDLCRESVSQLNDDGYIPKGVQRRHIHSFESAYSICQNYQWRSYTITFRLNASSRN